jgi:hypothetical protein
LAYRGDLFSMELITYLFKAHVTAGWTKKYQKKSKIKVVRFKGIRIQETSVSIFELKTGRPEAFRDNVLT